MIATECEKEGILTVRCAVSGTCRVPFCVSLYDRNCRLVDAKVTDKFGTARFEIPCSDKYTVCAASEKTSPRSICSGLYLQAEKHCCKHFVFEVMDFPPAVRVDIKLEDAFYSGFPISQGVIYLWRR